MADSDDLLRRGFERVAESDRKAVEARKLQAAADELKRQKIELKQKAIDAVRARFVALADSVINRLNAGGASSERILNIGLFRDRKLYGWELPALRFAPEPDPSLYNPDERSYNPGFYFCYYLLKESCAAVVRVGWNYQATPPAVVGRALERKMSLDELAELTITPGRARRTLNLSSFGEPMADVDIAKLQEWLDAELDSWAEDFARILARYGTRL